MEKKRKKRVILIGRSTAGKTTLCQAMNHEELRYYKTQTVQIVNGNLIDTPGEYLERGNFRGALIVTAADADLILLLQSAVEGGTMFPPMFSTMFPKPCIGVVSKSDLADGRQIDEAKRFLKAAGAEKIYVTSSVTGEGIRELVRDLQPEEDGAAGELA